MQQDDTAATGADQEWTIRQEAKGDRDAIAAVVEEAFQSADHAALVDAIRRSSNFIPELSLVADIDDRVVGHVMISKMSIQDGDREDPILSLSPLAVLPTHQRRGIGSALVREVTARADARGEPVVVLEGDPAYYGRFGFEPASARGITMTLPSWAPPEAAQVKCLSSYDPSLRGSIVYPPAFDIVSTE